MLSIHTLPQTIIVCHSTYLSSYYFLIQTYITLLLIYYYLSHFIDLFCLFYLSFFLCLNKLVINWPSPRILSFCHSVRARLCDSLHQVIGTFCLHDFSHFSHRQVLLKHWYREFEIKKKDCINVSPALSFDVYLWSCWCFSLQFCKNLKHNSHKESNEHDCQPNFASQWLPT